MNRLIKLYDAGLCLIIEWPSGVRYSNQTCGHCCNQREIEGVVVPFDAEEGWLRLSAHFDGPGSKYGGSGAMRGLDDEDAVFIDGIIRTAIEGAVAELQGTIHVDRSRLGESEESWVHVIIERESATSLFSGFAPYPRRGVLTWPNSD